MSKEKESPIKTVIRFSQDWKTKNSQRLVADLISISRETNREPDQYYFYLKDRKLHESETNQPVEQFIAKGIEGKVFDDLQNWANQNDEGLAIWVSPPLDGVYPCSKVIISKIAYDTQLNKIVLNTAILFEAEIHNPELKRGRIYTAKDTEENLSKILAFIERKNGGQSVQLKSNNDDVVKEKAVYFASMYQQGYSREQIAYQMREDGFLGKNSISCPSAKNTNISSGFSFAESFSLGHEDQYGSLDFDCPHCGANNTRPPGQLIRNCQHCGGDVTC